ncbi:MAG: hypothetical protein AB9872_11845 [Solidesulfovibrio sp.]
MGLNHFRKSKMNVSGFLFWITLLLFCVLKLVVISGNEIVSEGSDSVEFLLMAKTWFWGYGSLPNRGPGFPIFVALTHFFDANLRTTSELLFMCAGAWFCSSLLRLKLSKPIVVFVYITIIFHPSSVNCFDAPMSEGVFVIFFLISLGSLVRVMCSTSYRSKIVNCIVFGLACILMVHTRTADRTLVFFAVALLIGCNYVCDSFRTRQILPLRAIMCAAAIVTPILLVNITVLSVNHFVYGFFGYNERPTPSELGLIHTLMTIDTGEKPEHLHILVTAKARKIAYELSPTMAFFEHEIEGPYFAAVEKNSSYTTFSRTGIKGQFDIEDTFPFVSTILVPPTISKVTEQHELRKMKDVFLDQISNEISSGLNAGKAKRRLVFQIFNPSLDLLFENFPKSLPKCITALVEVASVPTSFYAFYGSLVKELYNTMAHRNHDLIKKGPLEGFLAIPKEDGVGSIHFINNTVDYFEKQGVTKPFLATFEAFSRLGIGVYEDMGVAKISPVGVQETVPNALRDIIAGGRFELVKFHVPEVDDRVHLHFMKLLITLESGRKVSIQDLEQGILRTSSNNESEEIDFPPLACFITAFDIHLGPIQTAGYVVQETMRRIFNKSAKIVAIVLLIVSVVSAIGSFVMVAIRGTWRSIDLEALCVASILVSIVCSRIIFYALVDVAFLVISADRYLFPSIILFFPTIIVVCALSVKSFLREVM